jgi:hypothetical protein
MKRGARGWRWIGSEDLEAARIRPEDMPSRAELDKAVEAYMEAARLTQADLDAALLPLREPEFVRASQEALDADWLRPQEPEPESGGKS